jgi:hypothetical protein
MFVVMDALRAVEHMKPEGYMDAILGSGVVRTEPDVGEVIDIPDAVYWSMVRTYSPTELHQRYAIYGCGPGCQLKRSLAWWGLRDDGSCGCSEFAAQMDAWGPTECFRRLEKIVKHLREAAGKKGLPFLATAARMIIARAIEAARQELDHATQEAKPNAWTDLVRARRV